MAFLCYPGEPLHLGEKGEFDDSRWFSSRMRAFSDSHAKHKGVDTEDSVMNDAEMYGIAAVLKQLEDRGVVNDATIASAARMREKRARNALVQREEERRRNEAERKRKEWGKPRVTKLAPPTDVPLYRTIRCRRISGSDFAFEFEVEITSGKSDPMKAFELIQYQYADYIKNMYVISHPNADAAKMAVDFPHYELSNGHILGEAVVISLTPDSVSYDHLTRRGVVAVRFGAGQYEEARVWAKNNIEALVRDKNITLVTGSLPPQSRYYSLGETLKEGSILEIEFKTE